VNGDAVQGEPAVGAAPEPGAALGPLVTQDLDLGQAGVVVDRSMQVVVAAARSVGAAVDRPSSPAVDSVATPGGDAAQLLDIQVDQVAWPVMLIAADRSAAGTVQPPQPVHPVADQDPMDGGGRGRGAGRRCGRGRAARAGAA
jgi:hypothetical protein